MRCCILAEFCCGNSGTLVHVHDKSSVSELACNETNAYEGVEILLSHDHQAGALDPRPNQAKHTPTTSKGYISHKTLAPNTTPSSRRHKPPLQQLLPQRKKGPLLPPASIGTCTCPLGPLRTASYPKIRKCAPDSLFVCVFARTIRGGKCLWVYVSPLMHVYAACWEHSDDSTQRHAGVLLVLPSRKTTVAVCFVSPFAAFIGAVSVILKGIGRSEVTLGALGWVAWRRVGAWLCLRCVHLGGFLLRCGERVGCAV